MNRRGPVNRRTAQALDPASFAGVMATGIVSTAMRVRGADAISGVLLGIAIVLYVLLAAATIWRIAVHPRAAYDDLRDPARSYGWLTLVAASGVLGARVLMDGHTGLARWLVGVAVVSWALLGYAVPAAVILRRGGRPALAGVSGSWFMWTVSAQAVAVGTADLGGVLFAAFAWSVGVVLYLLVAALVLVALVRRPLRAEHLSPTYWIVMGATAITVLAGASILEAIGPGPLQPLIPTIEGLSFLLWGFGTWTVPLLVVGGIWRWARRGPRTSYEVGLWSIVFPLGMYAVATHTLAVVTGLPVLATISVVASWVALAAWVVVAADLVRTLIRAT